MNHEDIIHQWIELIESIEVDDMKRKVNKIGSSYPSGETLILSVDLDYLSNGVEEDLDFKSRRYSKWSFEFINIFIDILKFDGEVINNSNWSLIRFYDNRDKEYGYVEYRTFDVKIKVNFSIYMRITREKKLNQLGL